MGSHQTIAAAGIGLALSLSVAATAQVLDSPSSRALTFFGVRLPRGSPAPPADRTPLEKEGLSVRRARVGAPAGRAASSREEPIPRHRVSCQTALKDGRSRVCCRVRSREEMMHRQAEQDNHKTCDRLSRLVDSHKRHYTEGQQHEQHGRERVGRRMK
jgi:hypothetical protein